MSDTATIESVAKKPKAKKPPLARRRMSTGAGLMLDVLTKTSQWATARADKVSRFYVVRQLEGFRLYVIGREEAYNFDLGGELADFSREWAFPVMPMLIPASTIAELRAFFNPDTALGVTVGLTNADA